MSENENVDFLENPEFTLRNLHICNKAECSFKSVNGLKTI